MHDPNLDLTHEQNVRLERLAEDEPGTRVVGLLARGGTVTIVLRRDSGRRSLVHPNGRLVTPRFVA